MTTIVKTLNAEEIKNAQQQALNIVNSIQTKVDANTFIFKAGFDGTNNTRDNPAYSGDKFSTAVGLIMEKTEALVVRGGNIQAKYYEGHGTPDAIPGSSALPGAVTAEGLRIAEQAYTHFVNEASLWLKTNPNGEVSVMSTSFSRGCIADIAFKQLVFQRGVTTADGRVLVAPGEVKFAPSLMIDPVAEGAFGNLALPPGAAANTVVVRAENELRSNFRAADLSDAKITYVAVTGNHGDTGAFYDNGLGGIYLDAYLEFFRKAGLKLADLPAERLYDGQSPVVVHVEETVYGLRWPTDEGPRQTNVVAIAKWEQRFDDGSALVVMDDLLGNRIYGTQDMDGNWSQIDVVQAAQAKQMELQGQAALAGLDLIDALRRNNKTGTVSAALRLTEVARRSANLAPLPELQAAGGVLMLLDAWNGLQTGTDAQKFAHAARMVLGANEVARAMNDGKGFLESTPILGGLQGIVAIASLKDTLQSGNPFAIASSFMTITNAAVATGLVSSSTAAGAMGMSAFSNAAVFGPQLCEYTVQQERQEAANASIFKHEPALPLAA